MRKGWIFVVVALSAAVGLRPVVQGASEVRVEAESMTLASDRGFAFSDAGASGGRALLIHSNGSARAQVTTPASSSLAVRARGDQCKGAPRMVVRIDDSAALATTVSNTSWTTFATDRALAAGQHAVSVSFTNDHRTRRCDRNLRVDVITFVAGAEPTPTPSATPAPTPSTSPSASPTAAPSASPVPTPVASPSLYVDPNSNAKQQADAWRTSRPADAALIDKIASQPQGFWFGGWSGDVRVAVDSVVDAAASQGAVPVLVPYNIPGRDCGGYSAGGASVDAYRSWITSVADGIGPRRAIVVLEPDALAGMSCLTASEQSTRLDLLRHAVSVLKANPQTSVYIDAGHSRWLSPSDAATRLQSAGVALADGFSLNVSNFNATADETAYGNDVSSRIADKHFVIDTSRNGLGSNGEWCNPPGRALGARPALIGGSSALDGYLWVKRPGESDGTCNGGPPAGAWWPEFALGLADRAAW